jgi:hypothetical protein
MNKSPVLRTWFHPFRDVWPTGLVAVGQVAAGSTRSGGARLLLTSGSRRMFQQLRSPALHIPVHQSSGRARLPLD